MGLSAWIAAIAAFGAAALAAPSAADSSLPLKLETAVSREPLTTEMVWKLDPHEPNPHRRRWALKRETGLLRLRAEAVVDGGTPKDATLFRVRADGLSGKTGIFVRSAEGEPDPYTDFSAFPCTREAVSWFGTPEGALLAARKAAELWTETVEGELVKLEMQLRRLRAPTEDEALQRANEFFHQWFAAVDSRWRESAPAKAREAEWETYFNRAREDGECETVKKRSSIVESFVDWEKMMEPPSPSPVKKQLVRAPARRWQGRFTIRVAVSFDGKTLNGQFLLDTTTEHNLVSPAWLKGQGVNPVLLELKSRLRQKREGKEGARELRWDGRRRYGRTVYADSVKASGLDLGVDEFLLVDTQVLTPPEHISVCCDGVLGLDFLRRYAVEFHPEAPVHVKFYEREGFSNGASSPWVEAAITRDGELLSSSCWVLSAEEPDEYKVPGLRWATGSSEFLRLHYSWRTTARKGGDRWTLRCAGLDVVKKTGAPLMESFKRTVPGATGGIELLARGPFVLDIGHGRLWFDQRALREGRLLNRSGMTVRYDYVEGDRALFVMSVEKDSPAAKLRTDGLKPGTRIVNIGGVPAVDLDLWQVERILAGGEGKRVVLEWRTPKGARKVAPLDLPSGDQ